MLRLPFGGHGIPWIRLKIGPLAHTVEHCIVELAYSRAVVPLESPKLLSFLYILFVFMNFVVSFTLQRPICSSQLGNGIYQQVEGRPDSNLGMQI